jgi:hypothetical protein
MNMYGQPSVADLYRSNLEKAMVEIMSAPDRMIAETDTEDLVEHFSSKYKLTPISADESRPQEAVYKKRMQVVLAHQREEFYRDMGDTQFEFESINFSVRLIHNEEVPNFAQLSTSSRSLSWSIDDYSVTADAITVEFDIKGYGFDHKQQPNNVKQMLDEHKRRIAEWIRWVNADIAKENPAFKSHLTAFVNERKAKLEQDKQFIADLNKKSSTQIKIEDSEAVRKIILSTAPLVKKVAPRPAAPPEYELDGQMVLEIIAFVDNQGRQFERTPKSFADFDETALRNTLLVNLNSIFSGKATGETFSNKGKTDIYLNIEKGSILVFECKIWGGQVLYHATIDQLVGYLTWRHNFGVMVTFARKKNFGSILTEIPAIISSHPTFVNGIRQLNDTHFASHHRLPQDGSKTVEMHHLFYNLYSD